MGFFTCLGLLVAGPSLPGCVGERDAVNRVQVGAVPKSFFVGADLQSPADDPEFRTKSYNIDSAVNTSSADGAIGGSSALERVRFEVTENWLLVRRAYQESPGADARGLPRREVSPGKFEFPTGPTGTIVGAYRILGHFDVRRQYNAQTGEEANVIEENASDRPWDKRAFMRVDWSENLAQSTSGTIGWVFGASSEATAIKYSPNNPDDEDAPRFEVDSGYFDVTNKYQLKPSSDGVFGAPECVILGFFNGTTSYDCTPTEVKVRSSFVRLNGPEDFESFEEANAFRDIVGNWGNGSNNFMREYGGPPISGWDPQYGFTDAKTKTFYSIHNSWEQSHQAAACSSNADDDADGTADACANAKTGYTGQKGSQCDTNIGKCTIPVRDRSVRPIGYWLNAEAPQELTDRVSEDGKSAVETGPIEEMTVTWNQLIKVAIATRREVECRRTKTADRETCHSTYFGGSGAATQMVAFGGWGLEVPKDQSIDKGVPAVSTCHNPVRAYDPAFCGKPGAEIRLGDVRKNYAIYWPHASRAPYGGVATVGGDPLTGEMAGVSATIMMRSATAAAAQQRDIIQLALGDVTVEDYMQGVQASRYADSLKQGKTTAGMAVPATASDIEAATSRAKADLATIQAAVGTPASLTSLPRDQRQLSSAKLQAQSSPQSASIAAASERLDALVSKVEGSELRSSLGNRGLLRLAAESKDQSTPAYQAIKAFSTKDPSGIQEISAAYQAWLGNKGICFSDLQTGTPGTVYLASLAPYFKKLYGNLDVKARGERIYQDLLRESVKGIAFHEIGHSLGLRHNFASSWDALNYAPQYWQLRTAEGSAAATKRCTGPRTTTSPDACIGPRYLDPYTDDEQGAADEPRPGIDYFANTSTMEYQMERFGETVGAGLYDLHAMKVLYGRSLETFDSAQVPEDQQQYFAVKMLSQGIPKDLVFDPKKGYGTHYTTTALKARVFDKERDCRPATPAELASAKWRIVHGKVCSPSPKNHLAYDDMVSSEINFTSTKGQATSIGVDGVRWSGVDEQGQRVVRWPYRYGEDYSSGGYIHAKMGDSGADIYEIVQNTIRRYDAVYPLQYFRRQNKEFEWWALPTAVGGTFARLRGYHWTTTTDISRASAAELEDDDRERPSVLASASMFEFLQRVVLTPEPGKYGAGAGTALRTPTRPSALTIFDLKTSADQAAPGGDVGTVGLVDGRFIQVDFDNGKGGSWDYQRYPVHAGFDDEKVLAIRELVDSRPTLSSVSRENALDGRDPYISFRTDLPHAVDRLLGGILAEDWETIAPSMNADGVSVTGFGLLPKDGAALVRPAGNKGILFPNVGYVHELGTGVYATLFSRFSSDMTLANKLRVRLEGESGPVIPNDRKQAFTDPVTGYRYVAVRFGNEAIQGRLVETGIGSRMLRRASELVAAAYQVNGNAPNAFGEWEIVLSNGQPVVKDAAAEAALRRYIGLLDGVRQVGNMFGGGPLGNGGD